MGTTYFTTAYNQVISESVNGVVKDERTVNELSAYTYCLDKSG